MTLVRFSPIRLFFHILDCSAYSITHDGCCPSILLCKGRFLTFFQNIGIIHQRIIQKHAFCPFRGLSLILLAHLNVSHLILFSNHTSYCADKGSSFLYIS